MILMLDDHTRAHLARAIDSHRHWCRVNALTVPPLFHQMSVALAASGVQPRPADAPPLPASDYRVVAFTYDDAAAVLCPSARGASAGWSPWGSCQLSQSAGASGSPAMPWPTT